MPLRHRHTYAAVLQRGLLLDDINRSRSSPSCPGARRSPAQIRQVRAGGLRLRGFRTLVPHVHLPVLLAGPGSSDGADLSRRCQGCLPPACWPVPAKPGCPQLLPACCDKPEAVSFHHRTVEQRLVAHQVRHPKPIGTLRLELSTHEVGGARCSLVWHRRTHLLPSAHTAKAEIAHEARDRASSDARALAVELAPDLVHPVYAVVVLVHALDLGLQALVSDAERSDGGRLRAAQ